MFHLSYSSPCPIQGTLRLTRDPLRHGLGHYTDTDGNVWDVHAIYGASYSSTGRAYINARRVSCHPDYYGTHQGASSDGFHQWIPYYYTVETRAERRAS